jgi:hypothetical protein
MKLTFPTTTTAWAALVKAVLAAHAAPVTHPAVAGVPWPLGVPAV